VGKLNVAGVAQTFYDQTSYSDAGLITLISDHGNVDLVAGSSISVAAPAGEEMRNIVHRLPAGRFQHQRCDDSGRRRGGRHDGQLHPRYRHPAIVRGSGIRLNVGGFFEQRNLRIRTGDVTISNPGGVANVARNFTLSTDMGNILVTGTIDASGQTGGKILSSRRQSDPRARRHSHGSTRPTLAARARAARSASRPARRSMGRQSRCDTRSPDGLHHRPGRRYFCPGQFTTPDRVRFTVNSPARSTCAPRNAANNDLGIAAITVPSLALPPSSRKAIKSWT